MRSIRARRAPIGLRPIRRTILFDFPIPVLARSMPNDAAGLLSVGIAPFDIANIGLQERCLNISIKLLSLVA